MAWRRLGMVFNPDKVEPWMLSHAALPFPVHLQDGRFRIFFSTRNEKSQSTIGYVDIDIERPTEVLAVSKQPVLVPGTAGMYDDSGIGLGCIVPESGLHRMYYMGWNLGVMAPWRNSIGLALGNVATGSDGVPQFQRFSQGPIIDRSPADPFTISYPWVIRHGANDWHMWYGSNLSWGAELADMSHVIKHATSTDGINWTRDGATTISFKDASEYAMARPSVMIDRGLHRMWFACRGDRYRIGYAESKDGLTWSRRDEAVGIAPAESGWDSEMICYPCVFQHAGRHYMAYNGNGYGKSGFGLAAWED